MKQFKVTFEDGGEVIINSKDEEDARRSVNVMFRVNFTLTEILWHTDIKVGLTFNQKTTSILIM